MLHRSFLLCGSFLLLASITACTTGSPSSKVASTSADTSTPESIEAVVVSQSEEVTAAPEELTEDDIAEEEDASEVTEAARSDDAIETEDETADAAEDAETTEALELNTAVCQELFEHYDNEDLEEAAELQQAILDEDFRVSDEQDIVDRCMVALNQELSLALVDATWILEESAEKDSPIEMTDLSYGDCWLLTGAEKAKNFLVIDMFALDEEQETGIRDYCIALTEDAES